MLRVLGDPVEIRLYGAAQCGEGDERLALKKGAAQAALQPYDGVGQRGLGDAAAPGRSRETALLAERQEVADLVHLHGPPRGINRARMPACHRQRPLTVRWFTERALFVADVFAWDRHAEVIGCARDRPGPSPDAL